MSPRLCPRLLRVPTLLLLLPMLFLAPEARAQGTATPTAPADEESANDTCLECHLDPDTTKTVGDKEVPLVIDRKAYEASVHADEDCASCHVDFDPDDVPHRPKIEPVNCLACHDDESVTKQAHGAAGDAGPSCADCHGSHDIGEAGEQAADTASCLRCHEDLVAAGYPKSVHGEAAPGEAPQASCVACHGAHVVLTGEAPESPASPLGVSRACGECHDEPAREYEAGLHWRALRKGFSKAPHCASCHPPHSVKSRADQTEDQRRTASNEQCENCHMSEDIGTRRRPNGREFILAYRESVHGQKRENGSPAAGCVDCHGAHRPGAERDHLSSLGREQTAETCGRCHPKALADHAASSHGEALAEGVSASATCTDCHGEHSILPVTDPKARISPERLSREACGACHGSVLLAERLGLETERLETYESSYHGLASVAGSLRAANCASCHGYHAILPSTDPRSTVHPNRIQETCGECHPNATREFTRIPVHTQYDELSHPIAFTIKWIYIILILFVIGGMFAHNVIVYMHHVRRKWQHERSEPGYQRYMRFEVIQHFILLSTFTMLVITGFALKFPDAFWVQALQKVGMTEEVRRLLHRVMAVLLVLASFVQAGYFVFHRKGRREVVALLPRAKDLVDFVQNMLYHLGRRTHPPRFDRFDYTEKAEYLALIWGTAVMAITGFVLWFPELVSSWAPWWAFDVALVIHYYEAWLATLAILVWHMFFVVLHPRESPMSTVWLNGRMSEEEWKERHPLEYERVTGQPAIPKEVEGR